MPKVTHNEVHFVVPGPAARALTRRLDGARNVIPQPVAERLSAALERFKELPRAFVDHERELRPCGQQQANPDSREPASTFEVREAGSVAALLEQKLAVLSPEQRRLAVAPRAEYLHAVIDATPRSSAPPTAAAPDADREGLRRRGRAVRMVVMTTTRMITMARSRATSTAPFNSLPPLTGYGPTRVMTTPGLHQSLGSRRRTTLTACQPMTSGSST
mmetsp:Transcript_2347/g.6644  ORF Transcript_2347/g.6644 Transcript_2347/m.6644 type:complete len:217 (+) Transcript_2347:567-1217(+)